MAWWSNKLQMLQKYEVTNKPLKGWVQHSM